MFKYNNATPEQIRYYAEKVHRLAEEYFCTTEEKNRELLEFLNGDLSDFFQSTRMNSAYDIAILENLEAIDKVKYDIRDLIERMHSTGDILYKLSDILEEALSSCGSASMGEK